MTKKEGERKSKWLEAEIVSDVIHTKGISTIEKTSSIDMLNIIDYYTYWLQVFCCLHFPSRLTQQSTIGLWSQHFVGHQAEHVTDFLQGSDLQVKKKFF